MKKITIITGHYGSGETNLAVNLALQLADAGEKVTIVDFDIVNPYFRTADFAKLFEERGVTLAASMYANTSLDIPAISFDMERMAYEPGYLIVDVGGDDAGAGARGVGHDIDVGGTGLDHGFGHTLKGLLHADEAVGLVVLEDLDVGDGLAVEGDAHHEGSGAFAHAAADVLVFAALVLHDRGLVDRSSTAATPP